MSDETFSSPDAVVEAAFEAFRRRDGHALAALASPASLQEYVDRLRSQVHPKWHTWTVDDLRKHSPDMPVEAAEWQVRQMEQHQANHEPDLLRNFEGVARASDLESMSGAELLSRALRAATEHAIRLGWCRVLGHVTDGEDLAFVVFWFGAEDGTRLWDEPSIAVVDRVAGEWRLRLENHGWWGVPGFQNVSFVDPIVG